MATVKRAARRLVRLPDGTVGIRYIDLDTMQEVLDLTGYQILDGSQIPPDIGPKDNSENTKGRNQSYSEGSSDNSDRDPERKAPYDNIKNPHIANYLSQFPAAPNVPGQVTPAPELGGPLTVDPNFDPNNELGGPPSQPTEYGPEDGWGTPDPAGIPDFDDNRFTPGTPTVQAPTVEAPSVGTPSVGTPSATNPSQTVPDAPDPSRFGPETSVGPTGPTAQEVGETYGMSSLAGYNPNYEMAPGIETAPATSPFEGVPGIPGAVGLYTAAQVNIDAGIPSFQEAIGPDLTPEGLPANPSPRETTAQGVIEDTMDVSAPSAPVGARPEGIASGLPGARPGTPANMPDDSRFGGPLSSAMSFQDRLSQSVQAVSPAMSMNFEPGTPAATMPGLGMGIMSPGFTQAMDAARVDTPSSVSQAMESPSAERFGREAFGPEQGYAKSFNESLREANNKVNSLNQVDTQGNLTSQHEMSIGGYYDPNTMANRAFSQAPSQMGQMGMASSLPDTMSVTPSRAPREDQSVAKGMISKATNKSMQDMTAQDLASMSPARAATMGLISRTPAEISAMSKMMAGELHANTLKNLNSPNEEARALARSELANVATTVENRASSTMYDGLTGPTGALTPSQYNSLMASNMVNTNALYSKYGAAVEEALADFYSGALTPTNYDLTSYYNASLVAPNWGPMMTDVQKVGYHTFGKLPEYGPATAFKTERAALAQAYNETNRGFTPGVQASSVGIGTAGSIGSYSGAMNSGFNPGIAGSVGAFSGANKGGYSGAAGGIGSSGIGAGIAGSVGSFSGAMGGAGRGGGAGGGIGGGGYSGQAGGVGSSAGNTGVGTAGSGVGAGSRAGGGGYSGQAGGVGSSPGNTGVGTAGTGVGAGSRSSPGGGMGSTSTGSKGQRGI